MRTYTSCGWHAGAFALMILLLCETQAAAYELVQILPSDHQKYGLLCCCHCRASFWLLCAGLWQRRCPACGKFVVDLKLAERWCNALNWLCSCCIYLMPDVVFLDQRTSSVVWMLACCCACISSWWSCPMRVLGLNVWLDRLAYLTGWLNLSLSLPRTIGLKPDVAVTSTHNDHIHVHIHQPQMCKLECNVWKLSVQAIANQKAQAHKSPKF